MERDGLIGEMSAACILTSIGLQHLNIDVNL